MLLQALAEPVSTAPWHYELTFCDILAILGLIVGVAGLWYARIQTNKAKSAEDAVADFRDQLHQQRAAGRFSDLAPRAVMLATRIRSKNWSECAGLGTEIGAGLANATGFCSDLISADEAPNLELATAALEFILHNLPIDETQVLDGPAIQEMTKKCMVIVYAVGKIAGRLNSLNESGDPT
jgi:hypothetical protein